MKGFGPPLKKVTEPPPGMRRHRSLKLPVADAGVGSTTPTDPRSSQPAPSFPL